MYTGKQKATSLLLEDVQRIIAIDIGNLGHSFAETVVIAEFEVVLRVIKISNRVMLPEFFSR